MVAKHLHFENVWQHSYLLHWDLNLNNVLSSKMLSPAQVPSLSAMTSGTHHEVD